MRCKILEKLITKVRLLPKLKIHTMLACSDGNLLKSNTPLSICKNTGISQEKKRKMMHISLPIVAKVLYNMAGGKELKLDNSLLLMAIKISIKMNTTHTHESSHIFLTKNHTRAYS